MLTQKRKHEEQEEILMTFKLNPQLRLIKTPVIIEVEGYEKSYGDGEELKRLKFEKNYIIESMMSGDGSVVVTLKEDNRKFDITWGGRRQGQFHVNIFK